MIHCHADFETRSAVDLRARGAYVYAADPSTEVLCLAYAFGEPPAIWAPGMPAPTRLLEHVTAGGLFYGHNAGHFELPIWNQVMVPRYGWPELRIEQIRDTMAMAYAMALPASLENCAAALGLEVRKDEDGRKIMLKMCAPRRVNEDGSLVWWDTPEMRRKLHDYCIQDVIIERELTKRLLELSPYEQKIWQLDHHINATGVHVDLKAIEAARKIITLEQARLDREMALVTGGMVNACTKVADLTEWVALELLTSVSSLAKADLLELLEKPDLPPNVEKALRLRQEGAKASLAKLKAMQTGALHDGRVRGTLQYSGASTTRWTGRKTQTTNLPRPELLKQDEIDEVFGILESDKLAQLQADLIRLLYGPPMQVLADCVRGFLCAAPGKELVAADLAAIEARGVAWLAGQEDVVAAFASSDKDPKLPDAYCKAASTLFARPITKADKYERTIGKVEILSFGYGGGVGALAKMAKTYRVNMADVYDVVWSIASGQQRDKAEEAMAARYRQTFEAHPRMTEEFFLASDIAKQLWRADNPKTVGYWYDVEAAYLEAVAIPGKVVSVGPPGRAVRFRKSGSFLWAKMPSDGTLCFPYPEIRDSKTPWGATKPTLTYMGVDSTSKQWRRETTYGAKMVENLTQKICRDILVHGLLELNARGYFTPQHVYDEAVCEVPVGWGSVQEVEQIMSSPPPWAKGFPIAAEGWRGRRYRKG